MKWFKYLIYCLVMILTLGVIGFYYYASQTPNGFNNGTMFRTFYIIAPIIIGLLMGAEHLSDELLKKSKGWIFNVPRFLFLGIPTLILSFIYPLCLYSNNQSLTMIISNIVIISTFSTAMFSYILISNFSRKE